MYEEETFETILDRILGRMPSTMDVRESSFLYNATAPIAVELQNMYIALDNILNITYFDTADRGGKIERCKERGIDISQFEATKAVCLLVTTPESIDIPVGTRFNHDSINFAVTEKITSGIYYVECETEGTAGNITGDVTPVEYINGLETATIDSIYQYGEDEADEGIIDEAYYSSLNSQAFGGNRADYIAKMKSIAGIGGVKVYTASELNSGGNVKLVFTTSAYTKPTESFVDSIQTTIDPLQNQGEGYGIAPIGHTVTVAGVDESTVNIGMNLTLQNGYTWNDVSKYVYDAIDKYFADLNKNWENEKNIVVRISQIETHILDIAGIIDIAGTTLNGSESNLTIGEDQIAVRGTVNATT